MSVYYFQEKKEDLPEMLIDEKRGYISLTGSSYPEDISDVYLEFIDNLKKIVPNLDVKITCEFKFTILSSASMRVLHEIFLTLNRFQDIGAEVEINWYYDADDEDMEEIGSAFSDILDMQFNVKEN